MIKRDITLDRLRCFAMLWVILVHSLYWGNFFSNSTVNLVKSFCLFEMPLFFFVTGASNSFSHQSNYGEFVWKRCRRILIPYWFFAAICAVLSILKSTLSGSMDLLTAVKVLLSWAIPVDRQISSVSYLTWALWFIPVYLCVIALIPLFLQMSKSHRPYLFLGILTGFFLVTCLLHLGWIQNVAFYSLWTYIGLFYRQIQAAATCKSFRRGLVLTAVLGVACLLIASILGCSLDMQNNKFPPNITFGIFSFAAMAVILLSLPWIHRVFDCLEKYPITKKITDLYASRSLTIFLYQVFAFHLTIRLAKWLIPGSGILFEGLKAIFCFVITVPVCAALSKVFGFIERIGSKKTQPSI